MKHQCIATPVKVEPTYEAKGYIWYRKNGNYNISESSRTFGSSRGKGRFINRHGQQNTNWSNPSNDLKIKSDKFIWNMAVNISLGQRMPSQWIQ